MKLHNLKNNFLIKFSRKIQFPQLPRKKKSIWQANLLIQVWVHTKEFAATAGVQQKRHENGDGSNCSCLWPKRLWHALWLINVTIGTYFSPYRTQNVSSSDRTKAWSHSKGVFFPRESCFKGHFTHLNEIQKDLQLDEPPTNNEPKALSPFQTHLVLMRGHC